MAQGRQLFDRLMGGPVLAQPNGIMGVDQHIALLHERGHACGVARVFHEDQEGRHVGNHTTMQGHTTPDGGHGEFPDTVVDVIAAAVGRRDRLAVTPEGIVGAGQVC